MDTDRVRELFLVDDSVVSSLPGVEHDVTAQNRYSRWKKSIGGAEQLGIEYLIPRIRLPIDAQWPAPFMARAAHASDASREDLVETVEKLGPWMVPFHLAHGVVTIPEGTGRMVLGHRTA
jgi:hypothetical protein